MKIIYLSLLSVLVSTGVVAQTQKIAQSQGQSIPAVWTSPNQTKGATIFSEDFDSGIPSTWTNTTNSGPVSWKYTMVGHTGAYPTAPLNSESSNNGWILVDSDADNFSGGGAEDAQLMTPIIDCSGFSPVKIEFQQMFRRWQSDVTTVRVTTDGGTTYTDFVINSAITQAGTDNPDYVNIDITNAIAGNPANVQIVFWWQGAWDYGWQIDDFAVKEVDANDIILKRPSFSSDIAYYQIPQSQIQPMNFHAFAENIGFNTQTNVVLNVNVNNGSNVFSGTSNSIVNQFVGVTDSLGVVASFTPTTLGTYTVTYVGSQTETDDDLTNNTRTSAFSITDSVYAIDNNIYGGQWWNQETSGAANPFEIGAIYEIVSNTKTGTVSVFVGDNSEIGSAFVVNLYRENGTTYDFVGTADPYDITAASLGAWVTIPWTQYVSLNAGENYLVSVQSFGDQDVVYVGYGTNTSLRGSTVSNDGIGGDWNSQPRTPMIRLNVDETLGIFDNQNTSFELALFPNPAENEINVKASILNSATYSYSISDASGRIIEVVNVGKMNTGVHQLSIGISDLESGFYFLTFSGENASQSLSFVKK
jgi:hypothetical protein